MTKLSQEELMGTAYLAGRAARQKGENVGECPYASGTATRNAWENGWYDKDINNEVGGGAGPKPLGSVNRTSAGLRSAIFDELDALRAGTTDAKRAASVAKMASAIIETVRLELDVAKWAGQKNITRSGDSVALTAISFKPTEPEGKK
jgi:hypothetical protein